VANSNTFCPQAFAADRIYIYMGNFGEEMRLYLSWRSNDLIEGNVNRVHGFR